MGTAPDVGARSPECAKVEVEEPKFDIAADAGCHDFCLDTLLFFILLAVALGIVDAALEAPLNGFNGGSCLLGFPTRRPGCSIGLPTVSISFFILPPVCVFDFILRTELC